MYKFRYPIFLILLTLAAFFELKGNLGAISIWNCWNLISLILFISSVIFAVKYNVRVNPFRKTLEEKKTNDFLNQTHQNEDHCKSKIRSEKSKNRPAYHSVNEYEQENRLKDGNSNISLGQSNEEIKPKDAVEVHFTKDILSYVDEPNDKQQKKLQDVCEVLNSISRGFSLYNIESFKLKNKYPSEKYRLINKEGNIWLYFMGCTDGTHEPADYRDMEWLAFYYRGVAVELHFEEQKTVPSIYKLKYIVASDPDIRDLQTLLLVKDISSDGYYCKLREVLDLQCYALYRRPEYYVL